ncbi:hypothetical protein BASA62_005087 [Batrachochytrium salamandrivorans]|nr:hypothetical protein BASA62_005087 [Batrachochytrium salamandrivorans]
MRLWLRAGVELGRIKILDIDGHLSDASIELIALALACPNSELRELVLWHNNNMASDIENHLVPENHLGACVEAPQLQLGQAEFSDLWKTGQSDGGYVPQAPCVVCVAARSTGEETVLPVEAVARGDVQIGGSSVDLVSCKVVHIKSPLRCPLSGDSQVDPSDDLVPVCAYDEEL